MAPVRENSTVTRIEEAEPASGVANSYSGPLSRLAVVGALTLTSLAILLLMSPQLVMSPTLVTRGDLAAHVYPLHEFVTRLLPSGTMSGWSQGWFGGVPLYTFYFPLPALLVAIGTPFLGFAVAIKWMVASGPVTLPFAAYAFLRAMGLTRWTATSGAVVGSSYILMNSFNIFGGNLLSTFLGEFSYSISFSLSLLYLAVVLDSGRRNVNGTLAAATLLALTALSHVFTTGAVVAVTLLLLGEQRYRRTILGSWFLGFLFAGFWAVPFLVRIGFTSGPPWKHEPVLSEVLPTELSVFLPLAFVGAVWVVRRYGRAAAPLLFLPILAIAFDLLPQTMVHRSRLLPYGFFAVHALAGLALGAALEAFATRRSRLALVALTVATFWIVGVNVLRSPAYVRDYVRESLAGLEKTKGWTEYQELVAQVSQLPPGRVFREESEYLLEFGSPLALQLLPYWSPDHPVLSGLWSESSLSYPFYLRVAREVGSFIPSQVTDHIDVPAPFNFDRGIDHARLLGASYFIAFSDSARVLSRGRRDMSEVIAEDDWSIFELEGVSLIEPLRRVPAVYDGPDFDEVAIFWFDSLSADEGVVTTDGPSDWPRLSRDLSGLADTERIAAGSNAIADVEILDHSVSFRTTAIGVPHLIRVSYFPNWLAIGASGPYRATPGYMVVVPWEEEVRLEYVDSGVEWAGRMLTLLGLLSALFMAARPEKRRPPSRIWS